MKLKQTFLALGSRIKEYGISALLYRLMLSWFLVSIFYVANSSFKFTDFAFFADINLTVFICTTLFVWLLLIKIKDGVFIKWVMILAALAYAVLAAIGKSNFPFSVGLSGAVGVVLYFTDIKELRFKLHKSVPWIFGVLVMGTVTAFVGTICCLYYLNHWTPCYDFGLFAQMFHNMKETGLPLITCERDTLLSHFAVHFSPVYYLILPLYMLFPNPCFLLIVQVLIVESGIIPLLLICKNHSLSDKCCCAFTVIYALYPCFSGGCFFYLHENNFLAPLLLWFVYFSEKKKTVPQVLFLLLVLSVKEDAFIYVIFAAAFFMASQKSFKRYLPMIIGSVIYFVIVTYALSNYGDGVMTGRYDNYIYDQSGSLITALKAVIKNPVYVLSQCFTESKLLFILNMLVPLAFLPLLTKKPSRYLLLVPFLLINLMTEYKYQSDIGFHYCFGSGTLLIYLSVINYADLKKPKLLLFAAFTSLIVYVGIYSPRNTYLKSYENQTREREAIDTALSLIPEDASVSASTFFIANLSDRSELYQLETTKQTTEYYAIDLRYSTDEVNPTAYYTSEFEILFYEKDIVAVVRRVGT
ncbi:MAG: DUF2079 domain-containing protein [Ruminococcus sp.]|nr:DUF2079 domain-containing protein [Ruminococcus sp.]